MGEGFRIIKDISKIAAGVAVALTTVNGCAPTPVRCVPPDSAYFAPGDTEGHMRTIDGQDLTFNHTANGWTVTDNSVPAFGTGTIPESILGPTGAQTQITVAPDGGLNVVTETTCSTLSPTPSSR
jgi:hypothetical protein